MTAHDDDQELVTIRIPRRAATLYAADLDVASSPFALRFGLIFGAVLLSILGLIGAFLTYAGVRRQMSEPLDLGLIVGATLGLSILAIAGSAATFLLLRAQSLRQRGLI